MRLRTRLQIVVATPLLGLVLIGAYSASRAEDALKAQTLSGAHATSKQLIQEIQRQLHTPIEEWRGYAASGDVQKALRAANASMDRPDRDDLIAKRDKDWIEQHPDPELLTSVTNSDLANRLREYTASRVSSDGVRRYGEAFITDRYGANAALSSMTSDYNQADEQWWQLAMSKGVYVSDVGYDDSAGIVAIDLCMRIDDTAGTPAGVIKVVVTLDSITDLVDARARTLKGTGVRTIALTTARGTPIHTTGSPDEESDEHAEILAALFEVAAEPSDGQSKEFSAPGAIGVVSAPPNGALTPWRAGVVWDKSTLFAPVAALRIQIFTACIILFALTAITTSYVARALEKRILKLARHANAFRDGLREDHEADTTRDEIGELSRAFREMGDAIEKSERELREERTLLESIIATVPIQIYWRDSTLRVTGCNQAFAEWVGFESPEHLIAQSVSRTSKLPAHIKELFAEDEQILAEGTNIIHEERTVPRLHAEPATVHMSKLPLIDSDGNIQGLLGGFIDVTERRQLETQLYQAQKLESIGQLAAGIAHEINTPAQYVGDNTRFIHAEFAGLLNVLEKYAAQLDPNGRPQSWQERAEQVLATLKEIDYDFIKDEIPRAIEQSIEGIDRITHIVRAMKDFSHPGAQSMEAADINAAIRSTAVVCSNRWKYVADIEFDLDESLPPVECLLGDLNQVILNLIVNAADAIESNRDADAEKGTIRISTSTNAEHAVIEITDTGGGIPESIRSKIFDPFFTTKGVGKGTGQGLAISHDVIVNKHGGDLALSIDPGVGTTFAIRLPLRQRAAAAQSEAA